MKTASMSAPMCETVGDNMFSGENASLSPFIYALHDFPSFQDGQITITKGEPLQLLSDNHWYWWYVRKLRDSSMGFVPAELIELPNERLARMNSEWNIELAAPKLPKPDIYTQAKIKHVRLKSVRFVDELTTSGSESVSPDTDIPGDQEDSSGNFKENQRMTKAVTKRVEMFHPILIC